VSLPLYPAMTPEDVERVAAAVKGIVQTHKLRCAFAAGA